MVFSTVVLFLIKWLRQVKIFDTQCVAVCSHGIHTLHWVGNLWLGFFWRWLMSLELHIWWRSIKLADVLCRKWNRYITQWGQTFSEVGTHIFSQYLFKKKLEVGWHLSKRKAGVKYYSPTVTHGKTFVYDFCVL